MGRELALGRQDGGSPGQPGPGGGDDGAFSYLSGVPSFYDWRWKWLGCYLYVKHL